MYFIGLTNAEAEDAADLEIAEDLDHDLMEDVISTDRKRIFTDNV